MQQPMTETFGIYIVLILIILLLVMASEKLRVDSLFHEIDESTTIALRQFLRLLAFLIQVGGPGDREIGVLDIRIGRGHKNSKPLTIFRFPKSRKRKWADIAK